MSALVIYESMWGNTRTVAEAVGRGLGPDTRVVEVGDAPTPLPPDIELLVIGGPTHAFSMSHESTRKDAVQKGAEPGHTGRGIREWLDDQPASDHVDVATFDTRVTSVRKLPGSAARAAAKSVRKHHLGSVVATESFYVTDMDGPLADRETERAVEWGAELRRSRGEHS